MSFVSFVTFTAAATAAAAARLSRPGQEEIINPCEISSWLNEKLALKFPCSRCVLTQRDDCRVLATQAHPRGQEASNKSAF